MTSLRSFAATASAACLLLAAAADAGDKNSHSPTYFGLPGAGPTGPVYKYEHPWTYSWFGKRHAKTAETEQASIDREYRIAMGQHMAAMNRLHERKSNAYLWAHPNSAVVPMAHVNANHGQGFGQEANDHAMSHLFRDGIGGGKHGHKHGEKCAECEKHANKCSKCGAEGGKGGCKKCGHGGLGGHGLFNKHGFGGAPGFGGAGAGGAPYYSAYPGMNREDALRYVEGFQYFPPHQLIRSPREFFMWDVKYGLGK